MLSKVTVPDVNQSCTDLKGRRLRQEFVLRCERWNVETGPGYRAGAPRRASKRRSGRYGTSEARRILGQILLHHEVADIWIGGRG
jgi:hypothetical protein